MEDSGQEAEASEDTEEADLTAEDSAEAEAVLGVEELREAGDENYGKGGKILY